MSEFENNGQFATSDGFNLNELQGLDGKYFIKVNKSSIECKGH